MEKLVLLAFSYIGVIFIIGFLKTADSGDSNKGKNIKHIVILYL